MNETAEQLKAFLEKVPITQPAMAEIIGVSAGTLSYYLTEKMQKNTFLIRMCKNFLKGDGQKLINIQAAFEGGAANRNELHRKRAAILNRKPQKRITATQPAPALIEN